MFVVIIICFCCKHSRTNSYSAVTIYTHIYIYIYIYTHTYIYFSLFGVFGLVHRMVLGKSHEGSQAQLPHPLQKGLVQWHKKAPTTIYKTIYMY